jgi:rod shape-determining protein MreC
MAPTSARRSGHSRRAQYGLFTGYVLAAIGAAVGAVLLGISLWRPSSFNGLRGAAGDSVVSAGQASAVGRTESEGLFETISGYLAAGRQNAALKKEVELARIRLKEADAVRQENARLKALLGFRESDVRPIAVARLVGSSAASTRRFAYLGAGRSQGVGIGMPVRSPRGVVGRVLEVGTDSSRVLLLSDTESVIPVRRSKDEVVAFAEGRGDGKVRIRLINLGINPLRKGDVFVTSGAGGYYRPGIAVAILQQVTSDGGVAAVIADPAATDFVSVEPIWQPQAIKAAQTPVEQEVGQNESDK